MENQHENRPDVPRRQTVKAVDLLDREATPPTWQELVSGERPVELEVGSGKGLFLQKTASARHTHEFVGVELAAKFANKAADRLARNGITNAKMLRGDAQRFLSDVVPSSSVVAVHVYFPDPWWRNKHKKRRVLNENVLADILRVLTPGGDFHFWTDVLDYYEHICGCVMDLTPMLGPSYVAARAAEHGMDYTTHFERRARINGQPVYRAIFHKPGE